MRFSSTKPLQISLHDIPGGAAGIRITLNAMARFARAGRLSLHVRNQALDLVSGLKQKDWAGQIRELFYFVRDSVRYVHDPIDAELVQSPEATLSMGAGDCDDKATLLASMLLSIGHPVRFVALGFRPGDFSHVLVETKLGAGWIALDATEPVEPGWYPEGVMSVMIGHI